MSNFGERWIYDSFSKSHVINDSSRATNVGLPVVSRQAKIIRWDWSMNMCHPYWNWNFTYIRDTYICHQLSQFREIGDSSSQPNQVISILKRDTVFFFFFFLLSQIHRDSSCHRKWPSHTLADCGIQNRLSTDLLLFPDFMKRAG